MLYIKFNFIFIFIFSQLVMANTSECLNLEFDTIVKRKVLFGSIENELEIKKTKCLIEINLLKYKYLKTFWKIDVCREPIHIKIGKDSVDVLKRKGSCEQNTNEFCKEWEKLKALIQDEGLIFANGEREKLEDQHGQIFCVYQLVEAYLKKGQVLSRYNKKNEFKLDNKINHINSTNSKIKTNESSNVNTPNKTSETSKKMPKDVSQEKSKGKSKGTSRGTF